MNPAGNNNKQSNRLVKNEIKTYYNCKDIYNKRLHKYNVSYN